MTQLNFDNQTFGTKTEAAFKTISEASKILDIKPHVLRFWETKFKQLKPIKTKGNRRYYREEDMTFLEQVKDLLYDQGFTIKGAQNHLKEQKKKDKSETAAEIVPMQKAEDDPVSTLPSQPAITNILNELHELKSLLG